MVVLEVIVTMEFVVIGVVISGGGGSGSVIGGLW